MLNFTLSLPFLKLDVIGTRLESNILIFSGDTSIDFKPVT